MPNYLSRQLMIKQKKAVFVHVMQVYGVTRGLNLLILNLITRWTVSQPSHCTLRGEPLVPTA